MLIDTQGFVLKKINFSDTSEILKIYTEKMGLLSFMVRGAKNPKNNNSGILRPQNEIQLIFDYRENKNLLNIRQLQLIFAPDSHQFGIFKSSIGMFMIEMMNKTLTEEAQPDPDLYAFLKYSFETLRNQKLENTYYIAFMYQLAQQLGIDFEDEQLSEEVINVLRDYNAKANLTANQRKEAFQKLENHYLLHINNFKPLKSIKILESIL